LKDKLCVLLRRRSFNSLLSYDVTINLIEVVNSDANSKILAGLIRQQLEKRVPFRRAMKTVIQKAQKSGVKGIKVQVSGRLNGAEIARTEWIREGQVPLHTLRANIDYFSEKALVI
jgi:small subunit ribosomal protein S3